MSLDKVWLSAASDPFYPIVAKDHQFFVASSLLLFAVFLIGLFGLNRSLLNISVLGAPASLAFGFGAVFMICAVGVYV